MTPRLKAGDPMETKADFATCDILINDDDFDPARRHESVPDSKESWYMERRRLEAQLNLSDSASTVTLRLALRRYRSLSRQFSPF